LKNTIEPTIGQSQPVKKQWANPELMLISTNNVNGGVNPLVHEQSIAYSHATSGPGTKYKLYFIGGGRTTVFHTKAFFYS